MALIYFYKPLKAGDTFTGNQLAVINNASDIVYREQLRGVGSFSFALPATSAVCEKLTEGLIVGLDSRFYGVIRVLEQEQAGAKDTVRVSGETLETYLARRITVYPQSPISEGLQGYDAIKDVPTETVAKYFVNNNCVNPTDPQRVIPGMAIAPDNKRGIANDRYMSRFEPLTDLLEKCLAPQKLGYRLSLKLLDSALEFDLIQGVNRTAAQYDNPRVILDVSYKNLLSVAYILDSRSHRNAFYASLLGASSDAETYTAFYTRDGEDAPQGADRFEQRLNISVPIPQADIYNQLKMYALKDASQYELSESLTCEVLPRLKYELDYSLGDFVTLQARTGLFRRKGAVLDAQITAITHTWGSGGVRQTLEFGEARPTRFDIITRRLRNGGM